MVSHYDCLRKTACCYKKIALHIFVIFLFDAHSLNSKYGVDRSFTLLKFKEINITDLIRGSVKEMPRNKTNNKSDVHYLTAISPNEKKELAARPCKSCSEVKRKESLYECNVRREKPSSCVIECFKIYHSKE